MVVQHFRRIALGVQFHDVAQADAMAGQMDVVVVILAEKVR
jgi:hypothetical protein